METWSLSKKRTHFFTGLYRSTLFIRQPSELRKSRNSWSMWRSRLVIRVLVLHQQLMPETTKVYCGYFVKIRIKPLKSTYLHNYSQLAGWNRRICAMDKNRIKSEFKFLLQVSKLEKIHKERQEVWRLQFNRGSSKKVMLLCCSDETRSRPWFKSYRSNMHCLTCFSNASDEAFSHVIHSSLVDNHWIG